MFFHDRIKNILPTDKVLEIGPGATPHPRSDVFLERSYESKDEYHSQLGYEGELVTEKKVVFYNGVRFPFEDKEFDYVICAHVLEHVDDVPFFLSELFRVANKGYLEYPRIYYEYLYNIDAHLNLLKFSNNVMHYRKKADTGLNEFLPVQKFLYKTLQTGHTTIIDDLIDVFMEGFEWDKPFESKGNCLIEELVVTDFSVPTFKMRIAPAPDPVIQYVYPTPTLKYLVKQLVKKFIFFK